MSKKLFFVVFIGFWSLAIQAQNVQKPKVVIGIVVDQMRADYLNTFEHHFSKGGFNQLRKRGSWFTQCYINYLPSYTGPGHASIYTGSVPSIHGIVGNNWYQASNQQLMYCVKDTTEKAIGGDAAAGLISPRNLKTTTIADELRLATNFRSRTFAVSLKDRGAVLPGGHTSNASYWMDGSANFMSSTFYMNELPQWVSQFNQNQNARRYLDKGWNLLNESTDYIYDNSPQNDYEGSFGDLKKNTFPYTFKEQTPGYIKRTPFGNSILFDFAKKAIQNENIGLGDATDFLAISFSATDYIGHIFGPNSMEVEDTYARFDHDLQDFIEFLNYTYGNDEYVLFLTADHGAAHNPNYLKDRHVPAEYFFDQQEQLLLNKHLETKFGIKELCAQLMNCQVYLNHAQINNEAQLASIKKEIIDYFKQHKMVQLVFPTESINQVPLPTLLQDFYRNSYYPKRSGDICLLLHPAVLNAYSSTGTSHGAWSPYDTHIPLLFYGANVPKQVNAQKVNMTDIAPTIANMLGITAPNGSIGNVILK